MLKIYVVLCCVMLNAFCDGDSIQQEELPHKGEAFENEKAVKELPLPHIRCGTHNSYTNLDSDYETVKKNIKILLENACVRGYRVDQSVFSLRTAYYSMHKKLQLAREKVLQDEKDLIREAEEREASAVRLEESLIKQSAIINSLDHNSKERDDAVRKYRRLYRKYRICRLYIRSDKAQHVRLRRGLEKYTSLQKELQVCVRQLETLRVVLNIVERENLFVADGYGTWSLHLSIFMQTWRKIEEQYF